MGEGFGEGEGGGEGAAEAAAVDGYGWEGGAFGGCGGSWGGGREGEAVLVEDVVVCVEELVEGRGEGVLTGPGGGDVDCGVGG